MEIVWRNVLIFIILHLSAIYGYILPKKQYSTIVFAWVVGFIVGFGTTVGAHRLYTHRTFKANAKLRFMLVLFQTVAVQNSMYEWVSNNFIKSLLSAILSEHVPLMCLQWSMKNKIKKRLKIFIKR